MNRKIIIFIPIIIALALAGYWYFNKNFISQTPPAATDSGVKGKVLLGPICPVMRIGDTSCADKPYATTIQVIAAGSPKSAPFALTRSDKDGNYSVALPPGEYALQPVGGSPLPRCETKEITVIPSKILEVNLSCDTGIR